ncbi:hypothetical protein O7608_05860 [Solwaraspora sp. WMMA2056]|uniref:hypothetical protein n=1 Tax=Solwaraspora sp. WMMA2056 TaxID=3015161 RepID=UPI00259B78F4|nr:hypothetical protein [Solwaraspora sp. WMMA2056]WJK41925.1 hypothetical protein O7608_05860 [Solwaraspora sp. WMMA2056]
MHPTTATIVRRWRWAATTTAVLLLIGGSVLLAGSRPVGGTADALPDRVGTPPWGALRITDPFPIGAAAVAVSGFGGDDAGAVAVVDAGADRYRVHRVGVDAPAGEVVLLSPDGTRLAHQWDSAQGGTGVRIRHLGDRTVAALGPGDAASVLTRPLAWSPSGDQLVVVDSVPRTSDRSAYAAVVSLVDVADGSVRKLATVDDTLVAGYAVAFAADGRRLALQSGSRLTIMDLGSGRRHTLDLPPGRTLAGKGAWQPDGQAVTLAERDGDDWRLVAVDPVTGADAPGPRLPTVADVTAVRLLGWRPDGSALVVAYQPASAGMSGVWALSQRIHAGHVGGVQLVSLAPGADAPTVWMTFADGVRAVDVADRAVATGTVRPAQVPSRWPGPRLWLWLAVGLAVVVVPVTVRLRRRYRAAGD